MMWRKQSGPLPWQTKEKQSGKDTKERHGQIIRFDCFYFHHWHRWSVISDVFFVATLPIFFVEYNGTYRRSIWNFKCSNFEAHRSFTSSRLVIFIAISNDKYADQIGVKFPRRIVREFEAVGEGKWKWYPFGTCRDKNEYLNSSFSRTKWRLASWIDKRDIVRAQWETFPLKFPDSVGDIERRFLI